MNTNGAIYATIRYNIVSQMRYVSFTLLKTYSVVILWIVILMYVLYLSIFSINIYSSINKMQYSNINAINAQ